MDSGLLALLGPGMTCREKVIQWCRLRLPPQANETRRSRDAPSGRRGGSQLRKQLLPVEAGRQFLRIQFGRNQDERVVVRRTGARAWSLPGVFAAPFLPPTNFGEGLLVSPSSK